MKTRSLGPTDLNVSVTGFGAMHLSLAGRPDERDALAVIHCVLDLGVTLIDTADSYCTGPDDMHHNERLVAKALGTYDGDASDVTVATKGGLTRPGGRWHRDSDPERLRRTIRESYEALGGERPIALWQHHAPDPDVPLREALGPAQAAVEDGMIRHVGLSNYSVEQIEEARAVVDVVSVQNQYSPWHRRPEESGVLDYCEEHGLAFLPYSPLGGRSRANDLGDYEVLAEMAEAKNISPQRLVLAWLMARSPAVVPIPGATRTASAEDSMRAAEVTLSDDEVRRIDEDV
jgi:pyridoxine 4-dehydrogenase